MMKHVRFLLVLSLFFLCGCVGKMVDSTMGGNFGEEIYYRINPILNPQRYQAIAYRDITEKVQYSRVYGLPGETVRIDDKFVFVNDSIQPEPPNTKYGYDVYTLKKFSWHIFETYELKLLNDSTHYRGYLKWDQVKKLKKEYPVTQIKSANDSLFRYAGKDSFYVPKKGDKLIIPKSEKAFYNHLIQENYVMNQTETEFTIKIVQDYYFLLDDNRHNANDSRSNGFIGRHWISGVLKEDHYLISN